MEELCNKVLLRIGQKIFNHRSKMNGLSTSAKWSMDLEKQLTI